MVILIYPLLVVVAVLMIWRTKPRSSARWLGFMVWGVAGALFTFSLLTGLSIGFFLLPFVVVALYWAIRLAPSFRDALGFIEGIGLILIVVASIHNAAIGWLVPGVVLSGVALVSFLILLRIDCHWPPASHGAAGDSATPA